MLRGVGRKTTFFMVKYVKNNCKDVKSMDNTRRIYLDNIRWITVCIVVIYHVIYMYNGVQPFGVIGPFKEEQLQDAFQYLVYPWMMALLFTVSGMTVRYYLEKHNLKECIRARKDNHFHGRVRGITPGIFPASDVLIKPDHPYHRDLPPAG